MTFKSISYWLWFIILAGLGLALIQVPLFNLLAFESCAVLTIGIAFAGAHTGVTRVHHLRRSLQILSGSSHQIVITLFWRTLGANLTLLIVPLVILSLNALRVKNCDLSDGFAFFFLLPVISCAYATAAGLFFGFWMKRRWVGYTAYLAYIVCHVSYVRLQSHHSIPRCSGSMRLSVTFQDPYTMNKSQSPAHSSSRAESRFCWRGSSYRSQSLRSRVADAPNLPSL